MAGVISGIPVKEGDQVKAGQPLIILEAMKMENQIAAPVAGTVRSIGVSEGDSVHRRTCPAGFGVGVSHARAFAQQVDRPLIEFTLAPLFTDDGIALAMMGISVVFAALVLVATVIILLPRVLAKISPELAPQTEVRPSLADEEAELSAELLAVIAAAVAETVRVPHRIVRIGG